MGLDFNKKPDMSVKMGNLFLKNPVLTASGTFGYGTEFMPYFDISILGGIVAKGISLEPWQGNPLPRIVETPCGMINSIGLQNVGVKKFVMEKLPWLVENKVTVIVNILGRTIAEYLAIIKHLNSVIGIAAIELNVSCPNVEAGGIVFGTNSDVLYELVKFCKQETNITLIVKLTPNVTDITKMAEAAQKGGADIISLINTVQAMAVDLKTRRPKLKNIIGGLSGPAIKPIALKMVYQASKAVDIPVIGIGGIMTPEDAAEFIMVGASAVQVGTANFIDPCSAMNIMTGLEQIVMDMGLDSIEQLRGSLVV